MSDLKEIPGVEELEKELNSGIAALKKLCKRNASVTLKDYQIKIIQGTLDDLVKTIKGEELEKEEV